MVYTAITRFSTSCVLISMDSLILFEAAIRKEAWRADGLSDRISEPKQVIYSRNMKIKCEVRYERIGIVLNRLQNSKPIYSIRDIRIDYSALFSLLSIAITLQIQREFLYLFTNAKLVVTIFLA